MLYLVIKKYMSLVFAADEYQAQRPGLCTPSPGMECC